MLGSLGTDKNDDLKWARDEQAHYLWSPTVPRQLIKKSCTGKVGGLTLTQLD